MKRLFNSFAAGGPCCACVQYPEGDEDSSSIVDALLIPFFSLLLVIPALAQFVGGILLIAGNAGSAVESPQKSHPRTIVNIQIVSNSQGTGLAAGIRF